MRRISRCRLSRAPEGSRTDVNKQRHAHKGNRLWVVAKLPHVGPSERRRDDAGVVAAKAFNALDAVLLGQEAGNGDGVVELEVHNGCRDHRYASKYEEDYLVCPEKVSHAFVPCGAESTYSCARQWSGCARVRKP